MFCNSDWRKTRRIGLGLMLVSSVILIFIWSFVRSAEVSKLREACEAKGGTYFIREAKCLDIKELK